MLRHTALFIHRDTVTEQQKLSMLRGLAFVRMECDGVRAGDYGTDLFGGSDRLRAIPPWKRTPRWRGRHEGPPSHYDVALHLDFDDEAGRARCVADEAYRGVARFTASVTVPDLTACIDWRYEGPPLVRRGLVRHTAIFVWADDAGEAARARALDAASLLRRAGGVASLAIGENLGGPPANFDWILDVQLDDAAAAEALLSGPLYAEAVRTIADATRHEWTARITHLMRGY
jgi:hypothetical protein